MAIGLKYGKATGHDAATARTRALVCEFVLEFTSRNGSANCTELLGWNLDDPVGYEQAWAGGLFTTKCSDLVRDAVVIHERVLAEDEK